MAPVWLLWAWCRLAWLGITPPLSAAGGNINPPVGRRLLGACGRQRARLEVGQRSVELLQCPHMPYAGLNVSETGGQVRRLSLTLCVH